MQIGDTAGCKPALQHAPSPVAQVFNLLWNHTEKAVINEPSYAKAFFARTGLDSQMERAALTLAMLEDVLNACLAQVTWEIWVVSSDEVVLEIASTTITERGETRADDRVSEAAMEDRKKAGYF